MEDNKNELHEFMRQATQKMQDDYNTIQRRTLEDPGTAGDQGEENWAELLRDWLPHTFHVVTKGRILGADGTASPQVDIIVLRPEYPKGLLHQKLYLAGGVLAAFECKTTLRKEHIKKIFENSIAIKSLLPQRKGTPYEELHSEIMYGLLAHSHDWKSDNEKVKENLSSILFAELENINHPRLIPDILCVSDLCNWSSLLCYIGPSYTKWDDIMRKRYGEIGGTLAGYMQQTSQTQGVFPIGGLIETLIAKLAYDYEPLRKISDYYTQTKIGGGGASRNRIYGKGIYTTDVYNKILQGRLVNGEKWNYWSMFFI